jgi:hypothetical protein
MKNEKRCTGITVPVQQADNLAFPAQKTRQTPMHSISHTSKSHKLPSFFALKLL